MFLLGSSGITGGTLLKKWLIFLVFVIIVYFVVYTGVPIMKDQEGILILGNMGNELDISNSTLILGNNGNELYISNSTLMSGNKANELNIPNLTLISGIKGNELNISISTLMSEEKMNVSESTLITDLTFHCSNGELGNRMMYYSVLYGIARLNNRTGFIQVCNIITCRYNENPCGRNRLDDTFLITLEVRPNIPENSQIGHAIHVHSVFPDDYRIPREVNMLVGEYYPVSVTHFLHVREEIRREFQFKKQYKEFSQNLLISARGDQNTSTFIGMHVRRTSYITHLGSFKKQQAPTEFYTFGIRYFRNKYADAVIVIISDDLDWCRGNFYEPGVFIPTNMSTPEEDLAVLSQCNHSIFDYGTYGFWGAFLAGGETMYYVDGIVDTQLQDPVKGKRLYPPEWIGVSNAMLSAMKVK